MAMLRARHGDRMVTAPAGAGLTLREVLEPTVLRVRTGCNGNGACGLCRVRVLSGAVSAPTEQEREALEPALLDAGVRLACQTVAVGAVELEVKSLAPGATWKAIRFEAPGGPMPAAKGLRVALDVGTSNLNLSLWDPDGVQLASLRGPNPQGGFGADVITRLQAADDPAVALRLARAVEQAVAAALREWAPGGGSPGIPCSVIAVGNTAMLALLQGSHAGLLAPGNWGGPARCEPEGRLRWPLGDGREAGVALVAPMGGFVGSDLLAAALAADLLEGEFPALLIDFGTNTEIALWDGSTLWVTSAAGGPAFEACGLHCGVPAEDGAICRVRPGSPLAIEVIGGVEANGVCATGLVDWIACLVEEGSLSRRGQFTRPGDEPVLGAERSGIRLHKHDVDLFQRAKAAIGAGIQVLRGRAGGAPDLRRVVTTGLFGRGLDIAHAQRIGLLPGVPIERVETHDNLALAGCERMLAAAEGARAVDPLRARARLMNLARCPEFEDLFLQSLFLEPMVSR